MTYEEAVKYILEIPKFTKKNDAVHTKTFLKYLGDPQDGLKVIHVAGTNGKGSVCAYLDGMLRSEEKRTGLFTSPHLVKINERIVVEGSPIDDESFRENFEKVLGAVKAMDESNLSHPTFFEFLLGMALCAFREAGVEYAILETGLGGRLDATSAVETPLVCAITSIGYDHMQYLGDTLAQIASEKAGIIRPGVPVFYAGSSVESDSVIEKAAQKNRSFCKKIGKDAYEILGIKDKHIAFSCSSAYYGNTTWELNNTGIYQPGNAMLAMEVMRHLFGENAHTARWRKVLSGLKWAGRMEEVLPEVYVDGAHNISAVEAFIQSIPQDETGNMILFSAVKDKEYEKMAVVLCRDLRADLYVVTHIDDSRGTGAERLGAVFRKYTEKPVVVKESAREAFVWALEHKDSRRLYCLGSLYLTGMIEELIQEVKSDAELRRGIKEV